MQSKNFFSLIRFSRVLGLSLLVVMLGGVLKPEAAVQPVSFGTKTDFGTGTQPRSLAAGDFNGDGKLDLAVANSSDFTVSILLGTGTGSFGAKTDFGTGSSPESVAVGDFNGDGKLDLAVANQLSDTVSILLGTGTGSFGAKTDFGTGPGPFSVAVGDFNGDGNLDLTVANGNHFDFGLSSGTVSILLGTGTGSFGAKADFGTGSTPASVAVGDFNGDGKLDLAVANYFSVTVSILLGTGTGSFGAKTDFGTGQNPLSVAAGDFNGDGKLDLAVANFSSNTVSILLGTGTGSFGAKTDFGTGSESNPHSVALGDFNGDGKLDLAVENLDRDTVSILPGTGTGSFGAKTDFGTGSFPLLALVRDFNGDGKLDLAAANAGSNSVSILLNTTPIVCSGAFAPKTDFGTGTSPHSVAVGDFNGDGKLDLAVTNIDSNTVSVLLGTGTGSFGAKTDFGTGSFPISVAVGDFNGDGKVDLAVANASSTSVSILLGTGTGSFGTKTDFGTGPGPFSVAVGDFNGDGKLDLAVANAASDTVSVLLGTGTGSFGAKTDFGTGSVPISVSVGDFNGDGKLDLAVANTGDDTVSILLGTGTGIFGAKTDFGTGSFPRSVAVGDFNGDGKLDLVVANRFSATVSILLGTGTGSFGAKTDFGAGDFPNSVAVGDFNGDGKLDLAVANRDSNTVSILLGTGTGSFGAKTDFGTGSAPVSVALGDFNGDGKLDLAVPNQFSATVSILLNACTGNTTCAIVGPANITTSNTTNQCGAVVTYNTPTPIGAGCGTITCSPPSGSFFPVGTTTVTCTSSGGTSATTNVTAVPDAITFKVGSNKPAGIIKGGTPKKEAGKGSSGRTAVVNSPAAVLYSQTGASTNGSPSQNFEAAFDAFDCQSADDFVVPAGEIWNVTQVNVGGTFSATGPATSLNVTFYNNSGTLPGATAVASYANVATFTLAPNFNITLPSAAVLPAGTYWVSVQANMDFGTGGQWFWSNFGATNIGSEYAWRNPGGGFGTPCAGFGAGSTGCHVGGGVNRNNVFDIIGTISMSGGSSTCTFTVTVIDTQPPTITCPANVTAVTDQNVCPAPACKVVNFPAPVASDNCPGVGVVCNPPAGSCFPTGVTTVTCTATDTSGNTATCSFALTTFDVALQDDSNPSIILLWNSITGSYRFCCPGVPPQTGLGKATRQGCVNTLETPNAPDRRVLGRVDKAVHAGSGSLQKPPGTTLCTITDRNTLNDTNVTSCQ